MGQLDGHVQLSHSLLVIQTLHEQAGFVVVVEVVVFVVVEVVVDDVNVVVDVVDEVVDEVVVDDDTHSA